MARNIEIDNRLMRPVFDRVKSLIPVLGYEIPIFKPGRPAIQSIKKSQMLIVISTTNDRERKTLRHTWQTNARFEVMISVPEKVPGIDIHKVATDFSDYLVDYYTLDACDDISQFYVNSVYWEVDVDEINRSEYTTTVVSRYYDYPLIQEG